jgi:hypothetical protein
MPLIVFIGLLASCRSASAPPSAHGDDVPSTTDTNVTDTSVRPTMPATGTSHSGSTGATAASSGQTGQTGDTALVPLPVTLPPATEGVLPPTTRFIPTETFKVDRDPLIIEPPGSEPILVVTLVPTYLASEAHYLVGLPPRGDVAVRDIHDGITKGGTVRGLHTVPDRNGDGVYDYWWVDRLLPGPIMGKAPLEEFYNSEPIAWLAKADPPHQDWGFGTVELVGHDFDGDGHDDALVQFGGANNYMVAFGPLVGEIADPGEGNRVLLGTGRCSESVSRPLLHPDAFGPGEHGVSVGGPDWAHYCPYDRFLLRAEAQRDVLQHSYVAELVMTNGWLQSIPDTDGDGIQPIYVADQVATGVWPTDGASLHHALPPLLNTTSEVPGFVMGHVGDVNGDGQVDYLGYTDPWQLYDSPDEESVPRSYVLLSPHADPLVIDDGVPIEPVPLLGGEGNLPPFSFGDLDGDGKNEIVYHLDGRTRETYDADDVVYLYSGADLTAADPRTVTDTGE